MTRACKRCWTGASLLWGPDLCWWGCASRVRGFFLMKSRAVVPPLVPIFPTCSRCKRISHPLPSSAALGLARGRHNVLFSPLAHDSSSLARRANKSALFAQLFLPILRLMIIMRCMLPMMTVALVASILALPDSRDGSMCYLCKVRQQPVSIGASLGAE